MKVLTHGLASASRLACPPWCTSDHHGDTPKVYLHTRSGIPVEVNQHVSPDVVYVGIEQTEKDEEPVLVLTGPFVDYLPLSPQEAARIGLSLLAESARTGGLYDEIREELAHLPLDTDRG